MMLFIFFISQVLGVPSQNLSGSITLNQFEYKTFCHCGNDEQPQKVPQCNTQGISIQTSHMGTGFSSEIIKDILEAPKIHVYTYIKFESFKCLDGRNKKNGLFTPGGDFGEFLLALHVYEGITAQLSEEKILKLFELYLSHMEQKQFYYCTDDTSIQHIEADLNKRFTYDRLLEPFTQDKKEILKLLTKSENHGDDHLKLLLQYPQYYSVRKELVQGLIKAFFTVLWDKNNSLQGKLRLESLSGKHQEGAFVEIRVNNKCNKEGLSPLIRTQLKREEYLQVYVNHVDAIQTRRQYMAEFFINVVKEHQDSIDPNIMKNRMNRHGMAFLEITGSFVAKNLPFFTITLS